MATERLEDGSGLELLGQISKKWPSVLRIFAADRQRLQLLRGRLGPFELFQTLTYPIDPQKLLATLEMAVAAQQGESQQIELTDEAPAEEPEAAGPDVPVDLEQSDEFSEPRFARAGRAGPMQVTSLGGRSSSGRSAPARSPAPAPRSRPAPAVSAAPAAPAPRRSKARAVEPNQGNDLASKFPGSGTLGPRRAAAGSPSVASGSASRSARVPAAKRAPPVRFPPLERTPPLERIPPLEPPGARNGGGDFSEAAAMARAARSNYEISTEEFDTRRLATMIGGGVAIAAVVVFLGFKMFGSKSEAPKAVAPPVVAHAPEYPPEVTELVAQTEAAFKADDFKAARADVNKLRQLSPSHPRLDFFEGLLTAKGSGAANGRGSKKKFSASQGAAGSGVASAGGTHQAGSADAIGDGSHRAALASAGDHVIHRATAVGASGDGSHRAGSASADDNVTHGAASASAGGTHRAGSADAIGDGGHGAALARAGDNVTHGATSIGASGAGGTGASAAPGNAGAAGSPAADAGPSLPPETPVGLTRAASEPAAGANTTSSAATPASGSQIAAPASTSVQAASAGAPSAPAAVEPAHTVPQAAPSSRRNSDEPPPVVQEARLVRRVNPDYPSAAKKDGISGFVDLNVTVSKQGLVEDVSVTQSTPPDMFDKSAVTAVRKWKYDPRFVDGLPSQAHLKVHLEFGPGK